MANILIIDDKPGGVTPLANELSAFEEVSAKSLHPNDVEEEDLRDADLVLVDYQLEKTEWQEREACPFSCQPKDGLALASLLRRHIHEADKESPTAFAILSSEVRKLASPLPTDNRSHVLARLNNLEWVFQKSIPGAPGNLSEQVIDLANAVKGLPANWPKHNANASLSQLLKVLGLEDECERRDQLLQEVADCIPPVHELSEWSHGLAIIRWLLQRILPYPCFLWDTCRLAARLRVDHGWLVKALESDSGLSQWLGSARYDGLLAGFAGPRWWRGRVEQLLWDATNQQSFDVNAVYTTVSAKHGEDAKPSEPQSHPFVCVDKNFFPLSEFKAAADCVRIVPDDWPAYADEARTSIDLAKADASLRALVISEDRGKLDADE